MRSWKGIIDDVIIRHSSRIRKATQPLKDHFNIPYFTYHRIDTKGNYTVLVDNPDWAEHYVDKQIYLIDPFLRTPSAFQPGMCLIENCGTDEYKETVRKEGMHKIQCDSMVILIQKNSDSVEFFGFGADKKTSALHNLLANQPQLFKSFGRHFKSELKTIIEKTNKEPGSLLELKGPDFLNLDPISPDISTSKLEAFYQDLGFQVSKLTPREKECIKCLIDGKSAKETALILGLSPRTVEFYFENIKNKLSCETKRDILKYAQYCNPYGNI